MKSLSKVLSVIIILTVLVLTTGCQKDSSQTQTDEGVQQIPVDCQVDNILCGNEMTIVSMFEGHPATSNTSLLMLKNDKPQIVIVFDAEDNIRAMYRGVVVENGEIIIDAHSTALAMVTCNPTVALIGDSNFSQISTAIESLPSFPELLTNVESVIANGNNIFDTTNVSLKQSVDAVLNELLGNVEDTTVYPQSYNTKVYVDHIPFVNHAPLLFELPGDSPDYGVGGNFALRNLALCPTYFGTLTTESGRVQDVIVRTRESYTALGITADYLLNNSLVYGERCYLMMDYNSDNTIHVNNLNDERAKMEIGHNFAQDIMRIIPFTLSDKAWANLATTLGSMAVNAVIGARSENRPIWEASKGIAKALCESGLQMIEKEIANGVLGSVNTEWGQKIVKAIGGKIFIYYSATVGTGNIGLRVYYMLKYPNDLEFCFKHKWDADNQCDIYMQCGPEPEPEPEPEPDNGDWVDLGLPSGILWATRNVGALSPTDYGNYYAWGETSPKNNYTWDNYQWCTYDSDDSCWVITKYLINTDEYTILTLLPEDDVASVSYGGRMPTKEDWEELFYETASITWTTINNVNGVRFTGWNGNSLFVPAAGSWNDSGPRNMGTQCEYWCSSSTFSGTAYYQLCIPWNNGIIHGQHEYSRFYGLPVRAVR